MGRLIDADALIESLLINPEECPGCPEPEWIEEFVNIIDLAPTVEIPTHGTDSNALNALDCIERTAAIDALEDTDWYHINKNGELVSGANSNEHEPLFKAADVLMVINELPIVKPDIVRCNQCKYYEGVHNVMGHAPCSFWKIGGVLWNDFCSKAELFRKENRWSG